MTGVYDEGNHVMFPDYAEISVFFFLESIKKIFICTMITSLELHTFMPVSETLVKFQGYSGMWKIELKATFP